MRGKAEVLTAANLRQLADYLDECNERARRAYGPEASVVYMEERHDVAVTFARPLA